MAEEQRCQIEGHRLCANNCGFFGSPATNDLCSKCFRDLRLKEEQASSAKIAVEKSLLSPPSITSSPPPASTEPSSSSAIQSSPAMITEAATAPQKARRCGECRRKVGVMGFPCRCGATFCGAHRYPEKHTCTFDFKAAGRAAIARANPVVKAEKLDKI